MGRKFQKNFELAGSYHRRRVQFKRAQTVVGQRFDVKGINGLSDHYYYNYYYIQYLSFILSDLGVWLCSLESALSFPVWAICNIVALIDPL